MPKDSDATNETETRQQTEPAKKRRRFWLWALSLVVLALVAAGSYGLVGRDLFDRRDLGVELDQARARLEQAEHTNSGIRVALESERARVEELRRALRDTKDRAARMATGFAEIAQLAAVALDEPEDGLPQVSAPQHVELPAEDVEPAASIEIPEPASVDRPADDTVLRALSVPANARTHAVESDEPDELDDLDDLDDAR